MKKHLRELFYIPKHGKGKITDKMLIANVGLAVVLILLCMTVMSLSAYAFFTHSIKTSVNTIEAASYDLKVTAPEGVTETDGVYFIDNQEGAEAIEVTFTLTKPSTATAKVGYCEIIISNDYASEAEDGMHHYYSEPIGTYLKDGQEVTVNERSYTIKVGALKFARVRFSPEWGSTAEETTGNNIVPPYLPLTEEDQAKINAGQAEPESEKAEQDDAEPTEPAETGTEDPEEEESTEKPASDEATNEEPGNGEEPADQPKEEETTEETEENTDPETETDPETDPETEPETTPEGETTTEDV